MMHTTKQFMRRMTALAASLALLLVAAACSGTNQENNRSAEDINRTEDGIYFDSGKTFCRGVWAADDGEKLLGYYVFYDAESGRFDEIQIGMGVPFNVRTKNNKAEFNLGAADFSDPATIENTGKGKRTLTWTNDQRIEYLTLLGKQEPDTFRFYSQKDLEEMAMDYYEANTGNRPTSTGVSIAIDGTASIILYGKKDKTLAEYVVDNITGKGTVKGTDEEILLAPMTTDD